jgi:phosphoserine phosphatase
LSRQVPVAVFSIAPQIALKSLLAEFSEVECFGTSAVVENQRLTRQLKAPLPYGEGRLHLGRSFADTHQFSLDESVYYGNSSGAVPLLRAVGDPICVNASARLAKVAQGMGWRLIRI